MTRNLPPYFDPRNLGPSLSEVASDIIKTERQDVLSRWFHSEKDVDLFIWYDERKNIIKQQVSLYGLIAEWNIVEGVKTGYVIETEGDEGHSISGSELIQYDVGIESHTLKQATELIKHIDALNDLDRHVLYKNFMESPQIGNMNPHEFMKRYGEQKDKLSLQSAFRNVLERLFKLLRPGR